MARRSPPRKGHVFRTGPTALCEKHDPGGDGVRADSVTAAVLALPLPVPVIEGVTEPARRQNAAKCHQQGNCKRRPQGRSRNIPSVSSHLVLLASGGHPFIAWPAVRAFPRRRVLNNAPVSGQMKKRGVEMKRYIPKAIMVATITLPVLSDAGWAQRSDDFGCSNATLKGEYARCCRDSNRTRARM